jgi:rare lipoprotein A
MLTNAIVAVVLTCSWERMSDEGKIAANGKPFDPAIMCAASRMWPLGTVLRVTDIHNGSSVTVTVTDKISKRCAARLDLSPAAFERLNSLPLGICQVKVTTVK